MSIKRWTLPRFQKIYAFRILSKNNRHNSNGFFSSLYICILYLFSRTLMVSRSMTELDLILLFAMVFSWYFFPPADFRSVFDMFAVFVITVVLIHHSTNMIFFSSRLLLLFLHKSQLVTIVTVWSWYIPCTLLVSIASNVTYLAYNFYMWIVIWWEKKNPTRTIRYFK